MKNILKYIFFFVATTILISCDDYLDIKPVGKVIPETLTDYRAVLTKGYDVYPNHKSLTTVRGDELLLNEYNDDLIYFKDIYTWNDVNPDRITTTFQYAELYNTIFYTNVIINEASNKLEASTAKDQLIGEAYALRAMAYFDLVNLFSKPYNDATANADRGVPLALEIDLEHIYAPENVKVIYNQIISDTEEANKLINVDAQAKGLNYRFSKAALYTMESRIFLYQNEWSKSLASAEKALALKSTLVDLNSTAVLANNYDTVESILALEDVFINRLKSASYASPTLTNVYDKTTDLRFSLYFEGSGSRFRFNKGGELYQKCSFRTSELYLTKAETSAHLNDLFTAKTIVLSFVKNRYTLAGINNLTSSINGMSQTALLDFIALERQREFAVEGQRWFDLRRTTQKQITHTLNGDQYTLIENDPRYTLPFPGDARLNNPEL